MEVLLDGDEIARRMGCTRRHVERLNDGGDGPPSIKLGRLRRYPESLFNEWVKQKIEEMKASAVQLESPQPAILEADPEAPAHIDPDGPLTARRLRDAAPLVPPGAFLRPVCRTAFCLPQRLTLPGGSADC